MLRKAQDLLERTHNWLRNIWLLLRRILQDVEWYVPLDRYPGEDPRPAGENSQLAL